MSKSCSNCQWHRFSAEVADICTEPRRLQPVESVSHGGTNVVTMQPPQVSAYAVCDFHAEPKWENYRRADPHPIKDTTK